MTAIATVEDVRLFLGNLSANQEPLVESLISSCTHSIGAYCNRDFASAERTEYRDGNGASRMLSVHYPITSFISLTINGQTIPQSVNGGSGFFFSNRTIVLNGYRFTEGLRNVVMRYVAGYGTVVPWPEDLKLALIMYVTTRMRERDRLGVGSKSLAGESISYTDGPSGTSSASEGVPAAARTVFENYMNTIPENGL